MRALTLDIASRAHRDRATFRGINRVQPAVRVPRHQPLEPNPEREAEAFSRMRDGAGGSRRTESGSLAESKKGARCLLYSFARSFVLSVFGSRV